MAFLQQTFGEFVDSMAADVVKWSEDFSNKVAGPNGRQLAEATAKSADGTFKGNVADVAKRTLDQWDVMTGGKAAQSLDRPAIMKGLDRVFQKENAYVRPEFRDASGRVPMTGGQARLVDMTENFLMEHDGRQGLADVNLLERGPRDGAVSKQELLKSNIGHYLQGAGFPARYVYPKI